MKTLELNLEIKGKDKVVALFGTHSAAEEAVRELGRAGFAMNEISIVGMDYQTDEHVVGFYNAGDRVKHWGKLGGFWGGLFGILFAPAFFWIPGIGPILTGGILGSALMGMIEGGLVGAAVGGGFTALGAALFSIGIPKDSALAYERALKAGKYLLMVHGAAADVDRAKGILGASADETSVISAA